MTAVPGREAPSTFAGCRSVEVFDKTDDATFPMVVLYPTSKPESSLHLGEHDLNASVDAAPRNGVFPLVLISHGSGGSPLLHRTLALHLARNGFVVGVPEHPFNNRDNNSLEGTVENLFNRPRHIRTVIDWFFGRKEFARLLKHGSVAVIGHSLGGYTALAAAGGVPIIKEASEPGRRLDVVHDSRIRALVLLAPATTWFRSDGALSGLNIPILLFVGDKDEHTPREAHVQPILKGVPDETKVECRVIENAGHFSFLSPYPPHMVKTAFPPSQDPPGFDRARFHEKLNTEVLEFLLRVL
ncbi:MAG: hypothetical protein LBD04_12055 [Synergistaceae bacterium]|jgi:predicted dienelactone hydrolase|nr:hypothetical protein [Synergistaceae bacterium]